MGTNAVFGTGSWVNIETVALALLGIAIFAGIVWFVIVTKNKAAEKFKQENPDAATIWIVGQRFIGVSIRKVDGVKAKTSSTGLVSQPSRTFIPHGEHVLTLEYGNADPAVNKTPEFKAQRFSEMKVSLEPNKDYTLLYNEQPGQYSLIEGKPEETAKV